MQRNLISIARLAALALAASLAAPARAAGKGAAEPEPEAPRQDHEPAPEKKRSGWLALPVLSYAPETSLVFGAFVMRYFHIDEQSHATTLGALATVSLKRQFIVELLPELHFGRNDYRVGAHLIAQSFPDRFYGVGSGVDDADAETYGRRSLELRTNFRRRIAGAFYGGLTADQLIIEIDVQSANGPLTTRDYAGERGGLSSGLGVAASFDDRDDRTYTTRGAFLELSFVPFLRALGSDYRFFRATLDARYFVTTWPDQVLGLRYVLDAAGGETPFYQLPQLGGPNSLRGYFRGKFRDATAQTLEAEYRAHLFWRFGAAAFAGIGQVGEDLYALLGAPVRPSLGGGLRFDLSDGDRYNLRVDAGGWLRDFGVYVAVLEAF